MHYFRIAFAHQYYSKYLVWVFQHKVFSSIFYCTKELALYSTYSKEVPMPSVFNLPSAIFGSLCNKSAPVNVSAPLHHQQNMGRMDTSRHFVTSTPTTDTQWEWKICDDRLQHAESISPSSKPTASEEDEDMYTREILDGFQFVESLQLDTIRLMFLIIDIILLMYRFCHLYIVSQTRCNGFDSSCVISEEDIKTTTCKLWQCSDQHQLIPLQTTATTVGTDPSNTAVEVYANHTSTLQQGQEDVSLLQQDK